jgi:hypothetical protein
MSTQRGNRASALIVPYPTRTLTDLPLRIVPGTTGTEAEICEPAKRSAKSTKSRASDKKKPARKNQLLQKRKSASRIAGGVRGAARERTKKIAPPAANSALAKREAAETTAAVAIDAEMTVTTDAAFALPVSPVLVMPEDRPVEAATLACNDMSPDRTTGEPCISAESSAVTPDETIAEPPLAHEPEEQPRLQAIALQWTNLLRILMRTWTWTQQKLKSHQVRKRLRVCESVSLGDKRFIAVIQVDGEQFLVGGSSSSVSTLAHLEPRREFSDVFRARCEQDLSQA